MFIDLTIKYIRGPHAGAIMPISCLGENNLLFRLDEVARLSGVVVVGVEVAGGTLEDLSEATQDRVRALLAKRV